ncbi:MAG: AEC family transporter [Otoolea sp.]
MVIDMQILISRLCVFVTLIGIGFLTFRAGLMTAELHDKLNTIIMRVLLPALLISTMAEGADGENGRLLLQMTIGGSAVFCILLAAGLLSAIVMRAAGDRRKTQIALMSFGSLGFFGIPLVNSLIGSRGTLALAMYSVLDNILVWTIGLYLSTGVAREVKHGLSLRDKAKKIIQPATVSVGIGLILMVLRVPSDNVIMDSIGQIGGCCSPLAMICIGCNLARSDLKNIYKGWPCISVVLVKMLLVPVFIFYILGYFPVDSTARICLTIIAGLPSSSMFAIMCKENGNSEVDYAARTAIITVFCSLITFPAVSSIIR